MDDVVFTCSRCGSESRFDAGAADTPVGRGEMPFICTACLTPEERAEREGIKDRAMGAMMRQAKKPDLN